MTGGSHRHTTYERKRCFPPQSDEKDDLEDTVKLIAR